MEPGSRHFEIPFARQQESQLKPSSTVHRHRQLPLYIVVGVTTAGGLLFGYDTAVISGAMLFLRESFALSPLTQELTVSAALFGATIGALLGGKMSDRLGRRNTLIVTALIFIVGALLTALSRSLPLFLLLRTLVGLSIGATACVVPVYISEIAPPHMRGRLVTCNQLAITVGIALSYWVDLIFANSHMGWPPMYAMTAIPGTLLLVGMLFNAETPRWLASKGRWGEAHQVLERLGGQGAEADRALEDIRASLALQRRGSLREFLRPGLRMALMVGIGLAIFQQLVGINTVFYYAPTIFGYAGFTSVSSAILATSLVGMVNILATVVAGLLIDKVGRRPLLLCGTAGMIVTLSALGAIFALDSNQAGYLTLAALLIYIVSFALSMGPVFWLMSAEIFPTRLRALGSSIATFANWSANLLVSMTFLLLVDLVGKPWTFWLYAILGAFAFAFCWTLVPETRKKSLEQIEQYWLNGRRWQEASEAVAPSNMSRGKRRRF